MPVAALALLALIMLAGCASTPAPHPLAEEINNYRAAHGLPAIDWSPALAKVADAHLRDIESTDVVQGACNLHSWSKQGAWTPCCYRNGDPAAERCMREKPGEITGWRYPHNGYEVVAHRSMGMDAQAALTQWRDSPAHHDVILNRGIWADYQWRAMGGALSDQSAILWFGKHPDKTTP